MEVKYLWGICGDEYGFGNRSKILWLESSTHVSESTLEDFSSVMWSSMCFAPWTTLLFIDDLFEHLAQGIWTIHMDKHEMYFSLSHQLPPRPMVVQRYYWDLMRTSMVLKIFFFWTWATCHVSLVNPLRRLRFPKGPPHVFFWMAGVASLTLFLGPINRCIPSPAIHISHNFLSTISSKSLI